MQKEKRSTITYKELPDTIGVLDYMKWRGCGRATADEVFHSRDFPKLNIGTKLLADKRAVLIFELGLKETDKKELLKEMAKQII